MNKNRELRDKKASKERYLMGGILGVSFLAWPTVFAAGVLIYLLGRVLFLDTPERSLLVRGLVTLGGFLLFWSFLSGDHLWGSFFGDPLYKGVYDGSLDAFVLSLWVHKFFIGGMSCLLAAGWSFMVLLPRKGAQASLEEAKSQTQEYPPPIVFTLGVCVVTGEAVKISDQEVNQGVLILGTTGVGKSVTLRRFMTHALAQGYPLFVIDGKPVPRDISILEQTALKKGVPFYGFNCASYNSYDPLSHGGPTVMKDKIMALKDYWSSDYYKALAEDYLQTMIFLLQEAGYTLSFPRLLEGLDIRSLALLLRQKNQRGYQEELKRLASYGRQELMGLHVHLSVLANSEIGHFFKSEEQGAFSISSVISKKAVGYFALPSLQYPNFAKTLGKLVINDIKASLVAAGSTTPIYVVIDEFSVFAGEQVLNIINMGRELGVHSVLATQGLADLVRVSHVFKDQLLNSINLMISHRLNDLGSIEECVRWMGSEKIYAPWSKAMGQNTRSSAPLVTMDRPILDKEILQKQLEVGEAMILSKRAGRVPQRIKVSAHVPLFP